MKAYSYIRWSSAQQTKGHSRERQSDLAAEYAARHKLKLDNLSYQDHGVSAFKGKNVSKGKLGAFIRAIDAGHIDTPCYLLVEDIDRLSRNEIDLSLELLLSLTKRGVTLVTLQDQAVYSTEGMRGDGGVASLFIAIVKLQGAHEYSARLGRRVRAAHDKNKKLRTTGKIVSKVCPSWLKAKDDMSGWIVLNDKVKIVKHIFALAKAGNGIHKITKMLNDDKVPNIGTRRRRNDEGQLVERERFWSSGNVSGLFRNENVFGRWRSDDGKYTVDNYYPEIVSKVDFYSIKAARKRRQGTGGFNQGITNLFSGVTRCAYCGKALKIRRHRVVFLQCRNSLHNACSAKRIPYANLESDLFNYLVSEPARNFEPEKMDESVNSTRRILQQQIAEKQEYLDTLTSIKHLTKDRVKAGIAEVANAIATTRLELDALQSELAQLTGEAKTGKDMLARINALTDMIYQVIEEPSDELRKEVRERIREHIKFLDVAPYIDEHRKHWSKFKIDSKPSAPLHVVRITYTDGTIDFCDIDTDTDGEQRIGNRKKNAKLAPHTLRKRRAQA